MATSVLEFDPNDPFLRQFSRAGKPVNKVVSSDDPFVRKVVDASRARAQAAKAPTATSAPITDNPAPVATARAATTPSFGQRVLGTGRALAKGAGAVTILATGAEAASRSIKDDPTASMSDVDLENAGRSAINAVLPAGVGPMIQATFPDATGAIAESGARAGTRAVGFGRNALNVLTGDIFSNPVRAPAAPGAVEPTIPQVAGAAEDVNVEPVGVAAADQPRGFVPQLPFLRAPVPSNLPPRPVLSKEGSIFSALADFQQQVGNYGLAAAERNARQKAEIGVGKLNNDAINIYNTQVQDAEKNRLAEARIGVEDRKIDAAAKAAEIRSRIDEEVKGREVIQGPTGDITIVNKRTGTAQKVQPTERPSYQQFREAAAKDARNKGATEAELQAAYKKFYGGK